MSRESLFEVPGLRYGTLDWKGFGAVISAREVDGPGDHLEGNSGLNEILEFIHDDLYMGKPGMGFLQTTNDTLVTCIHLGHGVVHLVTDQPFIHLSYEFV